LTKQESRYTAVFLGKEGRSSYQKPQLTDDAREGRRCNPSYLISSPASLYVSYYKLLQNLKNSMSLPIVFILSCLVKYSALASYTDALF